MAQRISKRRKNASQSNTINYMAHYGKATLIKYYNKSPVTIISDDELEHIHDNSLRILEEDGIEFLLPEARQILKKSGATVLDGQDLVKLDRHMIMEYVSHAPSQVTLEARNPERNLCIGDDNLVVSMIGSPPYSCDLNNGRRVGNLHDFRNFLKISQTFGIIGGNFGYPVEPVDIPVNIRHLTCIKDVITLTDKNLFLYSLGKNRVLDVIEMAKIALQLNDDDLLNTCCLMSIINTNSPRKLDKPMLNGIIELSGRNQLICITPFTLAGAMAPVSLAGALSLQNAEALAGIAFTQMVRKGAPVLYGGFTSNVDMKSGAPAFGTPEYMKTTLIGAQLARKYNVPFRTSNTNASNKTDAQAAYESMLSLWGVINGNCDFMMHGAGWLEGGLQANFEKAIIDIDNLYMLREFLQPLTINEAELAKQAISDVEPGGHFFGTAHTQARYKDIFYSPLISDWRNWGSWQEAGAPDAEQRANAIYHNVIEQYQPPHLDAAIAEQLNAFVNKRIEEGGADDSV